MTPTISVIIPTLARPSLVDTVISCEGADEVILIPDGADALRSLHRFGWLLGQRLALPLGDAPLGACGHPRRNEVLDEKHGRVASDWVVSIDDDDEFVPSAFAVMRAAIAAHPYGWFIFRMTFGPGSHCPGVTVWNEKRIRIGNVGTPMIVAPAHAKARWGMSSVDMMGCDLGAGYFGDHDYAVALEQELGPPVWCEQVIATVRPRAVEAVA